MGVSRVCADHPFLNLPCPPRNLALAELSPGCPDLEILMKLDPLRAGDLITAGTAAGAETRGELVQLVFRAYEACVERCELSARSPPMPWLQCNKEQDQRDKLHAQD